MQTHLTMKSRNAKTGPIPVSTTAAQSCPTACPFNSGGGCYAASGPLALHWRKVSEKRSGDTMDAFLDKIRALPQGQLWRHNQAGDLAGAGDTMDAFLDKIRALPAGQLWRHNQAGDLAGAGDALDVNALDALVSANDGKRGFTYTHKPLAKRFEQLAIARANSRGFTINLSANNAAQADALAELKIAPVVCVLPADASENSKTPAGRKIVVCPATIRDDVSCATCKLCAVAKRDFIVGFPAHGTSKRKADAIAREVAL